MKRPFLASFAAVASMMVAHGRGSRVTALGDPIPHSVRSLGVVLLDLSQSVAMGRTLSGDQHPKYVAHLENALAKQRLEASAGVQLGTFANRILFAEGLFRDGPGLAAALRTLDQVGGPSPVWDAVDAALVRLETAPDASSRFVVLVTDGLAGGNRVGADTVVSRARQSAVLLHTIGVAWRSRGSSESAQKVQEEAYKKLNWASERTGGTFQRCDGRGPTDGNCLEKALRRALTTGAERLRG